MATDSEQSSHLPVSLPISLSQAQDSFENPRVVPEQESAMVIPMLAKRTRNGVGRIVSCTQAMPEPIVEFDVE